MERISKKDHIKVIDIALNELERQRNSDDALSLCRCLRKGLYDILAFAGCYAEIPLYIPLFTKYNARVHGRMTEERYHGRHAYWWGERNYRDRRRFLLWIKEN